MKVIETNRLIIRHMNKDDAEFILGLLNQPTWLRFIGDRGVKTLEDAQNYILQGQVETYARLGFGFYIVELKESGSAIGMCGLAKRDYLDDVDIGFALLPQYCGNGYAYESASAVFDYAKNVLGLKRLVATTRVGNQSSAKLLEKLGLRFERMMPHPDGSRELLVFAVEMEESAKERSVR
ncbi:MAG TPA: GNAT family N-acetyltransferase [Burkholderiaceae bacterium]|nr:GNAT family N-acetyltransferase [Burkholderiaceae bacterium]